MRFLSYTGFEKSNSSSYKIGYSISCLNYCVILVITYGSGCTGLIFFLLIISYTSVILLQYFYFNCVVYRLGFYCSITYVLYSSSSKIRKRLGCNSNLFLKLHKYLQLKYTILHTSIALMATCLHKFLSPLAYGE